MKHNYLLHHKYQKAGWILAVASPVFFTITCVLYNLEHIRFLPSSAYTSISYLLMFSGMFLIAFSREKVEDEMIRDIRFSSVAIAAGIQFAMFILFSLIYAFDHTFRFITSPVPYLIYRVSSSVLMLFLIYIIVFRTRLYLNR